MRLKRFLLTVPSAFALRLGLRLGLALALSLGLSLGLSLLGGLSACGEDTTGPGKSFSLEVAVVDSAGGPVAGLTVKVAAHSPELDPVVFEHSAPARRRAATVIRFTLPESSHVTLEISELDERPVRDLVDGVLPAGVHSVEYDARDSSGVDLQGTHVLACRMRAFSVEADSLVFEEIMYPVFWPGPDWSRQTVLGVTDSEGRLRVTDRELFPGLLDLPELVLVDIDGGILGTFTIDDTVDILVTDSAGGNSLVTGSALIDGPNRIEVAWSPQVLRSPLSSGSPVEATVPIPPFPLDFDLLPNFPNPFN